MSDARNDSTSNPGASNWVDAEFAGEHGTTASPSSVADEKQPGFRPQNAHEVAEKVKAESSEEPGLLGNAKKALEETDRQIAGEYEKRDDRQAPDELHEHDAAHAASTDRGGNGSRTNNPTVASEAAHAETERFDGLINEPGNPPRQPALDQEKRGDKQP
ncbi:MAG TPA: hypothetical protein VI434_12140 [Candidatus Dormibacteraeota bacterium]